MKLNESAALGWGMAALFAASLSMSAAADHLLRLSGIEVVVCLAFAYTAGRERSRTALGEVITDDRWSVVIRGGRIVELKRFES